MLEHPGKLIRDRIMRGFNKDGRKLSRELGIPIHEVARMVMEKRGMDDDYAEKLVEAYPDLGMTKDDWMNMQADYDREQASLPPEPPKYPGWYVVDKIMSGYYEAATEYEAKGAWVVKDSREIASMLSISHDDVQTLINPRPITEKEPNPPRILIDNALANELSANFPTLGLSSADWVQMQTNYDKSLDPQVEQDSDRSSIPGIGNTT